jgi:hypothetical protein
MVLAGLEQRGDRIVNPLKPDQMSPSERLAELAEILADGLMRLQAKKSSRSAGESGESSLHSMPCLSAHPNSLEAENIG